MIIVAFVVPDRKSTRLNSSRDLPSFPTRRSSDLHRADEMTEEVAVDDGVGKPVQALRGRTDDHRRVRCTRSEEHTSELQPRSTLFPYPTLFRSTSRG